jgi:hypothetical protein
MLVHSRLLRSLAPHRQWLHQPEHRGHRPEPRPHRSETPLWARQLARPPVLLLALQLEQLAALLLPRLLRAQAAPAERLALPQRHESPAERHRSSPPADCVALVAVDLRQLLARQERMLAEAVRPAMLEPPAARAEARLLLRC